MGAGAITTQPARHETGLRPVQLRRDLGEIATLIEFCFAPTLDSAGRAAIQEMRLLSRSGPLLWVLTRFDRSGPNMLKGFVWYEAGRLVGNVSLSPAGYDGGWVIANVAVHPDFRRHGIARHLMQAALDWVEARGRFATLQVEADNDAARALYDALGFRAQRTFTRWRRASFFAQPGPAPSVPLRALNPSDSAALYALAQRARPNEAGGLGWLRPTRPESLRPPRFGALGRLFSGRRVVRWGVPSEKNRALDAALIIETRLGVSTALFDLLVDPAHQGALEAPLVGHLIRVFAGSRQPLVTEHPADDESAAEHLRANYFRPERTLVHMIWPAGAPSSTQARKE